jgi:3-oxoacyl-(acyl-carrier-protein) synthase
MNVRKSKPIAVTGIGIVTAQGVGLDATWRGVVARREVIAPWRGAPGVPHPLSVLKVAACPDLPRPVDLAPRLWNRLSRTQCMAAVCADEALAAARLPRRVPESLGPVGLFMATTTCGMDLSERFYAQYRLIRDSADPDLMRRLMAYEVLPLLARRHQLTGLREVCLTTCVGSAMAIGAACDYIHAGRGEMALAGGAETLCRVVLSGFHALKVVAPEGCRPFDRDRPGITVGEGAAMLVLESVAHARRRGVPPLGFVRGFAATCDARHLTAPDPEGTQAIRAIRETLERADVSPAEIDYINAHGTGTWDNDAMETRAIRAVFGERDLPLVSSTKRLTGHTFGAAGAIEAVLCLQALRTGDVPVNAGWRDPDPALDLPVVRSPTNRVLRHVLSNNFSFGGGNTALVLARDIDNREEAPC